LVEKNTGGKRSFQEESGEATRSIKGKKKEYEWLKCRIETPEKK
jgi:hypothetical protein